MQTKIPHIKYRSKDPANLHFGIIEIEGEVIHRIDNLEEFYKTFGYTDELVKAGKLPDDFIWEAYVTNSAVNCAPCFQLHMIEYLIMHSTAFLKKYREQYDDWIATHAQARSANGKLCDLCKAKRKE